MAKYIVEDIMPILDGRTPQQWKWKFKLKKLTWFGLKQTDEERVIEFPKPFNPLREIRIGSEITF